MSRLDSVLTEIDRALAEIQHELGSVTVQARRGGRSGPLEEALAHRPRSRAGTDVTLVAGPFDSTQAVREFERRLSRLPGVCDVRTRGYEGMDRAIIDLHVT